MTELLVEVDNRDWKPQRLGKVYCSPACGNGCLFADYERSCQAAERLAKRLGHGFQPWLRELPLGVGWSRWSVFSGPVRVGPTYEKQYEAVFHDDEGRWAAKGSTPEKALEALLGFFVSAKKLVESKMGALATLGVKQPV